MHTHPCQCHDLFCFKKIHLPFFSFLKRDGFHFKNCFLAYEQKNHLITIDLIPWYFIRFTTSNQTLLLNSPYVNGKGNPPTGCILRTLSKYQAFRCKIDCARSGQTQWSLLVKGTSAIERYVYPSNFHHTHKKYFNSILFTHLHNIQKSLG